MSQITYTTELRAPRETIWPYLEDPDKIRQWMIGVVEDRPTSDGPVGVGSSFEMDIKEGRKIVTYRGEVTRYEPPRLMGVKMVGGCGKKPFTVHVDYELTDLGGGRTRLYYTCRTELPKGLLFALMAPLFKLMGRLMVRKFLANLRRLVEQPRVAVN